MFAEAMRLCLYDTTTLLCTVIILHFIVQLRWRYILSDVMHLLCVFVEKYVDSRRRFVMNLIITKVAK